MPRILFTIDSLALGGTQRQLCLLLKYLDPEWESRLISLENGPYLEVLHNQGYKVDLFERRYKYDLTPAIKMWRLIWEYKPSIVHSWGGLSSIFIAPVPIISDIKLIDCIRNAVYPVRHGLRFQITNLIADRVISNSEAGLKVHKIPSHKGRVIYNGIDPDRFESINHSKMPSDDPTTIVMAARMSSAKDYFTFIDAARNLSKNDKSGWRFIALGSGDLRRKLIKYAGDLISDGIIEFPEVGLDIIPYLNISDIGVLLTSTNHQEGLSNSIMEYMACELPVICSDSGGNREIVKDNETGYIITPGSLDDLIEKLLILKDNPLLARRMGRMGKKRVYSMCSINQMVNNHIEEYQELLQPEH